MKNLIFFSLAICLSLSVAAQNVTYSYKFNNGLNEQYWKGATLKPMCAGSYAWATIPAGIGKNVYKFDKGCGLVFSDTAGKLSGGSYTIELYFKLDSINGYKKIVDFDSLSVDPGFYNQNGNLVMYSKFTSPDSMIGGGVYQYIAITRDGTGKDIYIYHNNKVVGTLNDNTDQYICGTDKMLIFFKDDNGTAAEEGGGAVAMIQISNYAMDSTTIKGRFTNIAKTLGVDELNPMDEAVAIYPNPVKDFAVITIKAGSEYRMYDVAGRECAVGMLNRGSNRIDMSALPKGVYVLNVQATVEANSHTYKLLKE